MAATIQLIGLVAGIPTEWDGQYVVEYHPRRWTRNIIGAYLVTTPDRAKAHRYPDSAAAWETWRTVRGVRSDGKPDRPLTTFTVVIENIPE